VHVWLAVGVVVVAVGLGSGCGSPTPVGPCGDASGEACAARGEARLDGTAAGSQEGVALLEDACTRLGEAAACERLAVAILSGSLAGKPGVEVATGQALALLERGCEGGRATACYERGRRRVSGMGVPKDLSDAARWFGAACALGDVNACVDRGVLVEKGEAAAAPGEPDALFARACEAGDGRGCVKLGLRARDAGAPQDTVLQHFRSACDKGFAPGCGLGALTLEGDAAGGAAWLELLVKGAVLGDDEAARRLGDAVRTGGEGAALGSLADALAAACEAGKGPACAVVAQLQRARGEDDAAVAATLGRGCKGGSAIACEAAGVLWELGRAYASEEEIVGALTQGCVASRPEACFFLARRYETGAGVEHPDADAAIAAYGTACARGMALGCEAKARVAAQGVTPPGQLPPLPAASALGLTAPP
jgi:TPR repeat protein